MNFFKALFGGKEEDPAEKKKAEEAKNFDILKYDGVSALRQRQNDYAVRCFRAALEIKDDLEIRDYLSQALIQCGELKEAYDELLKLAEAEPNNVQIYSRMATVAFMMEDYNVMDAACEKALLIEPNNPNILFMYARACVGLDDNSNAIAMLTKAITLEANYADAYLLRAQVYMRTNELLLARDDAQWLLQHVEGSEDVLLLKARLDVKENKPDEALATYNQIIELNPFSADAYQERADLKEQSGDLAGAESDRKTLSEITQRETKEVDLTKELLQAYKNNNPFK